MKRFIGIMLAVVLLAGGVGGFAYAQVTHQPLTGQKLVGMGRLGFEQVGSTNITHMSRFAFTNPDCVGEITIRRISIFSGNGTVIYEGDLLRQDVVGGEVVNDDPWMGPMTPHKARHIVLWTYFPEGDGWMSKDDALAQDVSGYTVEIFYETERKGLPLIGHSGTKRKTVFGPGNIAEAGFRNEMFNMGQRLSP